MKGFAEVVGEGRVDFFVEFVVTVEFVESGVGVLGSEGLL